MKVNGNSHVPPVYEVTQKQRQTEQPGSSAQGQTGDKVQISADARWIGELRAEANRQPAVREELVSEVRAQIDAGTFGGDIDMDAVLEGLLADL